jgi:hypothetical protein
MATIAIEGLEETVRDVVRQAVALELAGYRSPEPASWLSTKLAAKHLGISEGALRARLKRGDDLPVHRRGDRLWWLTSELDEWVRSDPK